MGRVAEEDSGEWPLTLGDRNANRTTEKRRTDENNLMRLSQGK
jgi:hypothetical protein